MTASRPQKSSRSPSRGARRSLVKATYAAIPELPWLPVLETGVVTIDREHRRLIDDANALQALLAAGAAWSRIVARARKMRDACIDHFRDEEALLAREAYGDAAAHMAEHRRVEAELRHVVALMESTAAPGPLRCELAWSMRTILIDHLLRFDLKYKSHLLYRRGR